MDWHVSTQTHCGNVRKINEDALMVKRSGPLMAVADGMGGHLAGEVASGMIVDYLSNLTLERALSGVGTQIEAALQQVNQDILDYGRDQLAGVTIGSTVVTLAARGRRAVCVWAGDSRLYRLRRRQLEQLTEDHSYVAEMVREGLLSPEEARHHPSSNMITRAIGVTAPVALSSSAAWVPTSP